MTGRKKRLIFIFLLAAAVATAGIFIYRYYTAPQRKIEKLVWELRGCPDSRLTTLLAKIGIKSNKSEPRPPELVMTDLAGFGKLATPYLIDLLRNEKDSPARDFSIRLLVEVNDPAVIDFFKECLRNKDPAMTEVAAANLKDTCGSQSLLEFTDLLTDSNNLPAAVVIADALGDIGGKQATDLLYKGLCHKYEDKGYTISSSLFSSAPDKTCYQSETVKSAILEAMTKLGDRRGLEYTTSILRAKLSQIMTIEALAKFYYPSDQKAADEMLYRFINAIRRPSSKPARFDFRVFGEYIYPQGGGLFQSSPPEYICDPIGLQAIVKFAGPDEVELLLHLLRFESMAFNADTGEIINALVSIGDKRAINALVPLTKSQDEGTRNLAIDALMRLNARDELIKLLSDEDPVVIERAAHALVKLKDPRLTGCLLPMLADTKHTYKDRMRPFAIKCLSRMGDTKAIGPLRNAMKEFSDIRRDAIFAIGKLAKPNPLEYLGDLWNAPNEPDCVNKYIAMIFLAYGGPNEIETLVKKVSDANQEEFQSQFRYALYNQNQSSRLEGPFWHEFEADNVIALLKVSDANCRYLAAWMLGEMGDKRAIGPLLGGLKDDDANVRFTCANSLCQLGQAWAVKPYIEALARDVDPGRFCTIGDFEDPEYTPGYFNNLGYCNSNRFWLPPELHTRLIIQTFKKTDSSALADDVIDLIEKAEKDYANQDRRKAEIPVCNAIQALGILKGKRAFDYLSNLQRIRSVWGDKAFQQAVLTLGKFANPETIQVLVDTFNSSSPDLQYPRAGSDNRRAAIVSIGAIGGPKAVDALMKFLDYGFIDVRMESARSLLSMNDPSVQPALEKAAGDIHWQVRAYANAGLYRLGNKNAIDSILAMLKSEDSQSHCIAIDILRILNEDRLKKYLIEELLKNPEWKYSLDYYEYFNSMSVIDALAEIGGSDVLEAFNKLKKHWKDELEDCVIEFYDLPTVSSSIEINLKNLRRSILKVQQKLVSAAATQP